MFSSLNRRSFDSNLLPVSVFFYGFVTFSQEIKQNFSRMEGSCLSGDMQVGVRLCEASGSDTVAGFQDSGSL